MLRLTARFAQSFAHRVVQPGVHPATEEAGVVSACRACDQPIRWARTAAGKLMPLDEAPDPNGNVVLVDGTAVVMGQEPLLIEPADRFMPHWASCPEAASFKKATKR